MKQRAKIEMMSDGWVVYVGSRRYSWDHNNADLGTGALAVLLTDLGLEVTVEEVY